MLKRFFINVIATIVGVFVTPNIESVAKGEVVVIEESFGVRITEIVNASRTGGK